MTQNKDLKSVDRRDVIKLAGIGIGAVGGAAALPEPAKAAAAPAKRGYRETEHVKKAYATARF